MAYFESHFDRYRPQVRQLARTRRRRQRHLVRFRAASARSGAAVIRQARPAVRRSGELRPGAQAVDYFHALLSYGNRRVVLHASMLAAAESPRYVVHGTRGSYVKYGPTP